MRWGPARRPGFRREVVLILIHAAAAAAPCMVRRFQPFLLRKERKTLIVTDDAGEEAKGKGRAARFYLEIDR